MKSCPICAKTYEDAADVCATDGATLKSAAVRRDQLVGTVIKGRYRIVRRLGAGGMGTVYLAEQLSIGRNVALKVLHGEFARDEEFIKRFHQEARLAASLSHRNVVTVHDFDQADDGSLFIVMEYIEGRNLKELIQQGPLDVARALQLGIQIAEGLGAAHRAGVIHRDIKPENIMLVAETDEVKLMDFGIARLRETGTMSRLTRSGIIMGTPAYMAPEQIEGQDVSIKTDIYAFGIVLYQMLTGVVPFDASTPSAVLIKHLQEQPLPIRNLRADIPSSVERVVMQALQKKPEQRQKSLTEVVRELEAAPRQLHGITAGYQSGTETFTRSGEAEIDFHQQRQTAEAYDSIGAPAASQGVAETLAETRRITAVAGPKPKKWKRFGIAASGILLAGAVALGIYFGVTWLGAPQVVSLKIEADRSRLEPNERTQVRLRALDSDGAERQLIEGVQWQSSDSSVATVSPSGEVEGIKPGGSEITALYGGKRSNPLWVAVNPREPPIESREPPAREIVNLLVLARKNAINVGERIEVTAVAKYSDGGEEKNVKDVTWESSDPGVANIDASGKLEGLREGQVRITARFGDRERSMTFIVKPVVQLISLAIHVEKTELKINERMAATVKGTYSDGRVVTVSKGLKWKSAEPSIAEVDPEGQVMANKSGNVTITASYGTVQSQPLTLSVLPDAPKLSGLRIYVKERVLKVGETMPLRVTGQYSDGKEVEISRGVNWRSTDKTVAEISSQEEGSPVVIGRSPGRALITGTYEGTVSSRLAVTVIDTATRKRKENSETVPLGRYSVIRSTTVLAEARKDSQVLAKLSPGINVNVVGASGEYLRIESKTGRPPGYILRGDVELAEEKRLTSSQGASKAGIARPVVGARWANSTSEAGKLALADCSQGGDGCRIIRSVCTTKARSPQYGAIAYSLTKQTHGYSVDYPDRESAQARALSECGADCKIAVWFRNACGVLAVGQAR